VKSVTNERLVREICDEAADPYLFPICGRQAYAVVTAFDALCDAVIAIWVKKSLSHRERLPPGRGQPQHAAEPPP
jgi:hypothetical protein